MAVIRQQDGTKDGWCKAVIIILHSTKVTKNFQQVVTFIVKISEKALVVYLHSDNLHILIHHIH